MIKILKLIHSTARVRLIASRLPRRAGSIVIGIAPQAMANK